MKQVRPRTHTPNKEIGKKRSYPLQERFLRFFGDLMIFGHQPRPFFFPHLLTAPFRITLLHDPRTYQVNGSDMRKAMANIKPGEILVRGFDNYVDGKFISGFFSHAGLYLGKVDADTIHRHWSSTFPNSITGENDYAPLNEVLEKALSGEQMVIHSMKGGIFMEDLLNFCRCDYMVSVRFPENVTRSADVQQPYSENEDIKKVFTGEERKIAGHMKNGAFVPFAVTFPVIFKLALSQLGKKYGFGLDFFSFNKMPCTEFVYYCTKSLEWCSGIRPVDEKIFLSKPPASLPMVLPDRANPACRSPASPYWTRGASK